ncbi:MAG: acetyl/propionyl/methylcrotonyl-CoA carboxylase subunit alpha [Gammaproteobacteria bacterium]
MFNKILIANRGEIACRVIRTAQRLGIETVAVYSAADAAALHVAMADEAVAIGPAAAQDSYLVIEKLIAAAKASGAAAIHPGYGFLSENAAFAHACKDSGIVFIGPPAAAIEAMGSKSAAKTIMQQAAVPLLPGYHGEDQDHDLLQQQATQLGYPLLIKAVAGGGGKGMRLVQQADEFQAALAAVKREAHNAFSDDKVLLERYLNNPRHIEIQLFRDSLGNGVFLFERDCSVQRRHQKILEEAPAPGMPESRRKAMGKTALLAAQAIDYQGAGTVEFIVDAEGEFYFMEMNTRLQVEHPVTEWITAQDLVEWQFRIAAGEPLPLRQRDLTISGHALEARLYAEDPDNEFLPCTGELVHLRFPAESNHVRIDTGVRQGDSVSVHYDPMIAKLSVWDQDRATCLRRMQQAIEQTQIVGLINNLDFIGRIIAHPAFQAGAVSTDFIAEHAADLYADTVAIPEQVFAVAALYLLLTRAEQAADAVDPGSPWGLRNNWQLNLPAAETLCFHGAFGEQEVGIRQTGDSYEISLHGKTCTAEAGMENTTMLVAEFAGIQTCVDIVAHGNQLNVFYAGKRYELKQGADQDVIAAEDSGGKLNAPMPGRIIAIMVEENQTVSQGQPLLILEAMKMEHTINANRDGTVKAVFFAVNDMVDEGVELIALE